MSDEPTEPSADEDGGQDQPKPDEPTGGGEDEDDRQARSGPDGSPDGSPEPTEPDESPDDGSPEPTELDESPDDGSPEPTELDESPDDGRPGPTELDESPDDGSPEPTEPNESPDGGSPETTDEDRSQDPTGPAEPTQRPRDIPGRRTTSTGSSNEPSGDGPRTFKSGPELICRKSPGSWQWEIILSVPQECNVVKVRYSDTELSAENGEYRLPSFSGSLVIEYADRVDDEIPLVGKAPLIFKLRNQWQGDGRKTRGITQGHFIVFAPCKWTRTGRIPVSPEGCVDTDCTAHYFFIDQDDVTGEVGGFEEYALSLTRTGFVLEGKRIHDDSEDGDLFIGDAPTLEPGQGIVWARMGEELENGWKGENFKPADQPLGDVLGDRQGRFFIRMYDESATLVDSGEFRYCADLQEIRVNGESYSQGMLLAPSRNGHSPATLQFVAAGAAIQVKLKTDNPHVAIRPNGVAALAPYPECDETTWSLALGGSVDVVIKLPRIWWRMISSNTSPGGWCDKAVRMSRDEYREQSQAEAKVEIRVPSSVKNVRAGFGSGKDLDQSFPVEMVDGNLRQVLLPLDAFVDYEEINEPSTEDVSLNIQFGGVEIVLIHIIPDPPPPELDPQQPGSERQTQGEATRLCETPRWESAAW